MKYLNLFSVILLLFIFSCTKKEENFKPTIKLASILKDKKINKVYYEFRLKNIPLSLDLGKQEAFVQFIRNTSNHDLLLLTECENPTVRCFAFKALVEKDFVKIRELLLRHQNDNEKVESWLGSHSRMNEMVKFYMLQQLNPFSNNANKYNEIEYEGIKNDFSKI